METAHFETMQRWTKTWREQIDNLKQVHLESKKDIESLIARREQQLHEIKKGK